MKTQLEKRPSTDPKPEHIYGVQYDLKTGSFTKEQLEKDGVGGCDAFVGCSIVRESNEPHEGGISFQFFTVDGRHHGPIEDAPELPDTQLFEVWSMLAAKLGSSDCPSWQKGIAKRAFDETKQRVLAVSKAEKLH